MGKGKKFVQIANKNAAIVSRIDRTGKQRTETQNRDGGSITMAISTDADNNSTRLFLDGVDVDWKGNVSLTGREARTLFRLIDKHYGFTKKSR